MRSFIGSTGAFLPEARALCSHAVLGAATLPPEPVGTGTLTLDGRTIQVREARPGEPPMFYSYPNGHPVGWVEVQSTAGSVVVVDETFDVAAPTLAEAMERYAPRDPRIVRMRPFGPVSTKALATNAHEVASLDQPAGSMVRINRPKFTGMT